MASRRRYESTADVLKTMLVDSAYEDADSVESLSTSEYAQSSVDSSASDEDVSDGQSS